MVQMNRCPGLVTAFRGGNGVISCGTGNTLCVDATRDVAAIPLAAPSIVVWSLKLGKSPTGCDRCVREGGDSHGLRKRAVIGFLSSVVSSVRLVWLLWRLSDDDVTLLLESGRGGSLVGVKSCWYDHERGGRVSHFTLLLGRNGSVVTDVLGLCGTAERSDSFAIWRRILDRWFWNQVWKKKRRNRFRLPQWLNVFNRGITKLYYRPWRVIAIFTVKYAPNSLNFAENLYSPEYGFLQLPDRGRESHAQ